MGARETGVFGKMSVLYLFALLCAFAGPLHAAKSSISSSGELKDAMYWRQTAQSGCIKLLNATHEIGCSGTAEAPTALHTEGSIANLREDRIFLVNSSELPGLLSELAAASAKHVRGILVAPDGPGEHNLDAASPQSAFSIDGSHHEWNPRGTGQLWHKLDIPIISLSNVSAQLAAQKATANQKKGFQGALHTAKLDASMQGSWNSSHCLAEGTCDPLGGHSVWAAFPPFTSSTEPQHLPVILVTARMDGIGLFHDDIVAADGALSGLTAMLAAAEILGNASDPGSYSRRLIFAGLAGEPWGFMGSKRLLWEMRQQANSTAPLQLADLEQVLELGQLGRPASHQGGDPALFFHSQAGSKYGNASAMWQSLSAASYDSKVSVTAASGSSLPPSSLWSFLRANHSIAGGVLAEFDTAYPNAAYATQFDTLDKLDAGSVASAALLTARTLHKLAGGSGSLQVDEQLVVQTVEEILQCLAHQNGPAQCQLASRLITPVGMPSNYVGVLHTLTKDSQDPNVYVKNDVARLVWNFLALRLSRGRAKLDSGEEGGCGTETHKCESGAVCVGYRVGLKPPEGLGQCMRASARYVPAYSTAIQCKDCDGDRWGQWVPSNASAAWEVELSWPEDPCWAESRWTPEIPSLLVFQKESREMENRVLLAGAVVTLGSLLLTLSAKFVLSYRLKQH